jgi:glycerophosphoryl diester phosphodiesterase
MIRDFELQGHRGARGLFPENTLEGFAATLALGVTSIELDVAVTRDGVAVVVHDPALNPDIARGPDGAWLAGVGPAVVSLSLAELARYDVGRLRPGSAPAQAHPDQAAQDGARIPTLAAVFALAAGSRVVVDVELKTLPDRPALTVAPAVMADAVLAAARAGFSLGRLVVRSFDWRGLRHLRAVCPELRLAWLTGQDASRHANPDGSMDAWPARVAAAAGASRTVTWAPAHAGLTEREVADAHSLGLRVVPWTVNTAGAMSRLIDLGVDGLCTDRPDIARGVMRAAGLALPDRWPA